MNRKGFTLVEMMIVVIIIASLMFLIVPNLTKSKGSIDNKTCEAYISLVEAQIQAYYLDYGVVPQNIDELYNNGYIKSTTCPNNQLLRLVGEKVEIYTLEPSQ